MAQFHWQEAIDAHSFLSPFFGNLIIIAYSKARISRRTRPYRRFSPQICGKRNVYDDTPQLGQCLCVSRVNYECDEIGFAGKLRKILDHEPFSGSELAGTTVTKFAVTERRYFTTNKLIMVKNGRFVTSEPFLPTT